MSIINVIGMIPKGGRYAKSVVNFVRKAPDNWPKFKEAIKQIDDLLKEGKLKLDGKQKTIFESNKNILKNHEKVTKDAYTQYDKAVKDKKDFIDKSPQMVKDLFKKDEKVSSPSIQERMDKIMAANKRLKELEAERLAIYGKKTKDPKDPFKGWTPTVVERQNLRNIYKDIDKKLPPQRLYTKEMEAIDEELNELMLYSESKYAHLSQEKKAALFRKLQAKMQKLIKEATENDPTKLSLSQINKKSHDVQKKIREIADNPNIPGTVTQGPKKDMIAALYDGEHAALYNARKVITKRNSELKYGTKYPVLDPDNNMFIVIGLDESGHPIKVGRTLGKFSATKDAKTGDLTRKEGTSFWDRWDSKKNQIRKEGEEIFHETLNNEGKVIMSNPNYKIPKTPNLDIQTEFYSDLSINDLAKKGFQLKQIDMIKKGREVLKYLKKTESPDVNIRMHEQTSSNEVGAVLEDLYNRGDDVYKMTMQEWVKKIPEYFAGGGRVPGFATGGVSNLFRQRQGYRDAGSVINLVKGARWVIRMLKEIADDMVFGTEQFAKMAEPEKIKLYKETQAAIKHLEAGGPIPENLIQNLRQDARFKNLTVSKGGDKDFIEIQEVVLGKQTKSTAEKLLESKEDIMKHLTHDFKGRPYKDVGQTVEGTVVDDTIDLMAFKKSLPKDLLAKVNEVPVEKQTNLLRVMKRAYDAAQKGGTDKGVDVLQEQILTDFIPKGKPHATGGLIDGYATGGVSNLFRSR